MQCKNFPDKWSSYAAARGTRMGDLALHVPKPMVTLAGKPILEHQFDLARRYGCNEVILLTGHLGEVIESHFRDGSSRGLRLQYHREEVPLGTAGALKEIEDRLEENFFVFYGDTMMDVDLARLAAFHAQGQAQATLVVHPNHHPYDSDLLDIDAGGRITAFYPKPRDPACVHRNLANAALYVLSRDLLRACRPAASVPIWAKTFFPPPCAAAPGCWATTRRNTSPTSAPPSGCGRSRPTCFPAKSPGSTASNPRPAVFLDRDGVLNVDTDPVVSGEQLRLLPAAAEAVRRINRSEYLAVVVTNQPAIAKGFMSEADLAGGARQAGDVAGGGARTAGSDLLLSASSGERLCRGTPGIQDRLPVPKARAGHVACGGGRIEYRPGRSFMIGDRTRGHPGRRRAGCKTDPRPHRGRRAGRPLPLPARFYLSTILPKRSGVVLDEQQLPSARQLRCSEEEARMIGTRTPFRISFAGGGSDLRSFYCRQPGCVLSTSINKYMYILIHPFFDERIQVKYSRTELVNSIAHIQHPIVRVALDQFGLRRRGHQLDCRYSRRHGPGIVLLVHGGPAARPVRLHGQVRLEGAAGQEGLRNRDRHPQGPHRQAGHLRGRLRRTEPDHVLPRRDRAGGAGRSCRRASETSSNDNLMMFYLGGSRSARDILAEQQDNIHRDKRKVDQRGADGRTGPAASREPGQGQRSTTWDRSSTRTGN